MVDTATMQAIAALGAMILALLTLIGGCMLWIERRLIDRMNLQHSAVLELLNRQHNAVLDRMEQMDRQHREAMEQMDRQHREALDRIDRQHRDMQEQMDRRFQDVQEQMGQNHREVLALLEGHTHDGGPPPVFRRLTGPAD